ncbi:MAG: type II secretion system F family protein [Pirellulales bacterium]|nr:type II secretion system F family protein [Pirellulales bacterium]
MPRRKRFSTDTPTAAGALAASSGLGAFLGGLSLSGSKASRKRRRLKPQDLTNILRNLSTLVGNGVPLPKALATLAQEDSLAKHREAIDAVRRKVETGAPFSTALAECLDACDKITTSQIRVGERAGTLAETLQHLAETRDKAGELRSQVIKKLAYPGMLVVLGSGLITFLLLYVVPVFEQTYADAKVPLPFVTKALIAFGGLAKSYLWMPAAAGILGAVALKQLRTNRQFAARMDLAILRSPVMGKWLRDMAVLQVMDVLNNLMTAGFTLAEALRQTADSVGNRAVRQGVRNLQQAVERGERFSRELERQQDLFPPIVNQLVIVGESTGQLTKATLDICNHLRREIERKTNIMVGALEPILTISLAAAIAVILLAIYLPMFDMVNTVK